MFSVIIPLYNKELTISNTIQSVLDQTFQNFEIVIVNDGSTDNSVKEVEKFDDKRIRLIHQENQGVSAARNRGIEEANYEWIAFLDGDDIKHPESLMEMANQIEKYENINIFSTGYSIINPNSKDRYKNKFLPSEGDTDIIDYIDCIGAGEPPINSSNSAIRKSLLIHSSGFIKGQKNYEDHELWLRIYKENDIVFINKNLLEIKRDLPSTARSNIITAQDLKRYLQTIISTKNRLSGKKLIQFKKFYYLYCLYIINRIRKHYNKEDLQQIVLLMKCLIIWPVHLGIRALCMLSSKPK